jgi:hypothetical protein
MQNQPSAPSLPAQTQATFLCHKLLLRSGASGTLVGMPAHTSTPESFEIETISRQGDPENEIFVIHIRLEGTYEVRAFLSDNGVDEKRIAFAIEELSRSGQVKVSNQPPSRRAA